MLPQNSLETKIPYSIGCPSFISDINKDCENKETDGVGESVENVEMREQKNENK
jgi:hypothetical protein